MNSRYLLLIVTVVFSRSVGAQQTTSCPVVSPPSVEPYPEHIANWLRVMDGWVLAHDNNGFRRYPLKEGAKFQPFGPDETWPNWMWVSLGVDTLVNVHTGDGVSLSSGALREGAWPEGQRVSNLDSVSHGNGDFAWSGWDPGSLWVWRGEQIESIPWPDANERVNALALGPGGEVWLGWKEQVRRLDASGNPGQELHAAAISVIGLARHPHAPVLYVLGYEGMVLAWDLTTETVLWSWPAGTQDLALSPDGTRLATWGRSGSQIVDTATGCLIAALPSWGGVGWASDGRLAWIDAENTLRLTRVTP